MSKAEKKKIRFIKSPVGAFALGYFAGEVVSLETKLANECIRLGYAVEFVNEKTGDGCDLPADFPGREVFAEIGIDLEEAKEMTASGTLTDLEGIGTATAEKVAAYLGVEVILKDAEQHAEKVAREKAEAEKKAKEAEA